MITGDRVDPATISANKVKSLHTLQCIHDQFRSDVIGSNVIITPNPSYTVDPNSLQSGKESEYQYEYVQPDDGIRICKVVGSTSTASGSVCDKVIDPANAVYIHPNPSYSPLQGDQDVKLEDNPSYDKLKL